MRRNPAPCPYPLYASCARSAAVCVLERVERGDTSQAALDAVLRQASLDMREASLCTELVYGYLRTRIHLDYVLGRLLPRPHDLPKRSRLLLALAVYALLFLERVPAHATVHWTVDAVRAHFGTSLARVANGALRSLLRLAKAPLQADFYAHDAGTPLELWARYYAMPLWIAQLWEHAYGQETAMLLLQRSFARPVTALRLNPTHPHYAELRTALLEHGAEPVAQFGVAFVGHSLPSAVLGQALSAWFSHGAFSWQSGGSQCAVQAVSRIAEQWKAPVWDACAGMGGKALALLEAGTEVRVCSDVHGARLTMLGQDAARLGLTPPACVRASALALPMATLTPLFPKSPPKSPHDNVSRETLWHGTLLLDVPCSGLGTLARRPEIRDRMSPARIEDMTRLQARMLDAAWQHLGQGGQVVYMTCTLNPAENEAQIRALCERHPNAKIRGLWHTPHNHAWLEGMFVAVVEKGHFIHRT